jgi:hypothetical protein
LAEVSIAVLFQLLVLASIASAGDSQSRVEPEEAKKQRMFQTWLQDFRQELTHWPTNEAPDTNFINFANSSEWEAIARRRFDADWIHSSFGMGWDEIPAPALHGRDAVAAIAIFTATNGWAMHTDGPLFLQFAEAKCKPLRGLPWAAIRDREFKAITDEGILYVPLSHGMVLNCSGLAYNPRTNRFPSEIRQFKHIGDHWYVWRQGDYPDGVKQYEGAELGPGQPGGAANRSQPIRSETTRTSGAAGSGR